MPRSPGEWTEDDLLLLIRDSVEEGPDLEYKRCAALKKDDPQRREISKDVYAMANSAGGTIIYGMVGDGHHPIGLDVGFDPTDITKEWLEHVILAPLGREQRGSYQPSILYPHLARLPMLSMCPKATLLTKRQTKSTTSDSISKQQRWMTMKSETNEPA